MVEILRCRCPVDPLKKRRSWGTRCAIEWARGLTSSEAERTLEQRLSLDDEVIQHDEGGSLCAITHHKSVEIDTDTHSHTSRSRSISCDVRP